MIREKPSAKPRLLVLSSTYPRWLDDDEPQFVHQLCSHLTEAFDVCVVAPHAAGAAMEEVIDGVEIRRFRYAPAFAETLIHHGGMLGNLKAAPWKWALMPGFLISMAWATLTLRWRRKPDLVHAHWMVPAGVVGALVSGGAPLVVTSHGSDVLGLRGSPWRFMRRWVAAKSAALTAVGSGVAENLGRESARPVQLLPMGVDLSSSFTLDSGEHRRPMRVLYVGRLLASKRPAAVIAAVALLRRQGLGVSLEIVGAGPEGERLERQIRDSGLSDIVRCRGRVPHAQLAGHYRRAAVTVVASGDAFAPEGLGLVAIEALGCGCPVVSSPNPALTAALPAAAPIVFTRDASPEALAQGIRTCLEAQTVAYAPGEEWRDELVACFDWPSVARDYTMLFNQAIQNYRTASA